MPSQTRLSHSPLRGVAHVLAAVLIFACMDASGKYLMSKYNVPLVAAIRYGLNLILLLALFAPRNGAKLWQTHRTTLVILRGAALAAATFFMGLALQRMPVGETVAIIYLQGFGVMIAAGWFLKEKISLVGWLAAIAGFAGVVLIARPGGALAPIGVVFALLTAAVSVVYILLSRVLASSESTMAMLFYLAVVGAIFFTVMAGFQDNSFAFSATDLALLFFIGAGSLAGHFLLTSAYRYAPASFLAPFNYFHIALAVLLGWLVYDHVPDGWALLGMGLIAISGAALALYTHVTSAKQATASDK